MPLLQKPNRNVKIANKHCLFYSFIIKLSSNCGKINGFEMHRKKTIGGRFGVGVLTLECMKGSVRPFTVFRLA